MSIELSARIAFLKKIHLFFGLEDNELMGLAQEMDELSVEKDGIVVKQGAPADSFYMIHGGSVRIVRRRDGKDIQLAQLVKEDYFGEMALVSNSRRSATVTALEDTTLLILSRDDFKKLFREHPKLRDNLEVAVRSRQLAQQLRFKWLRPDEVVYFLARKHIITLYPKILGPLLLLLVPVFFGYAYFRILPHAIVATAAISSLFAALGWLAWLILDWSNDYYVVTNRRVVWVEKVILLYDSRQEAPLANILAVDVDTEQLGRILDYGDVVMRTYVGKIIFHRVRHPEQGAHMIEEYWDRTKHHAVMEEKEAMKNSIRRRLGIEVPVKPQAVPEAQAAAPLGRGLAAILRVLGANTLKIRYEQGDHVIYRKHWFVLIKQAFVPILCIVSILLLLIARGYQLFASPTEALFQIVNGKATVDTYFLALFLAPAPFLIWVIYETLDWSNDRFEVTDEQIIDIDRKPFGGESRNAAQLESILSTNYERKGFLGYILNYGTVYITVGGAKLAFEDVMDPSTVQADIDRRRTARKSKQDQARVAAERERMAEWLVTYHVNAEEFRKAEEEKRNQKNDPA